MKKDRFLLWIALCLLAMGLLASCASLPVRPSKEIVRFSLWEIVPLGLEADKVLAQEKNGLLFSLNVKDQEITVLKNGNRQNVLGGLGSINANFQYLSDMAIGLDGNLLVLDSSARLVRKFTSDGKVVGSLELKGSLQPTLLAMPSEQTLLVYDAAPAEIVVYSSMNGSEQFRFGRFQLKQITSLFCNRDYVVAYSSADNQSRVFSTLGQFVKSAEGNIVYDAYNNELGFKDGLLKSATGSAMLPLNIEPRSIGIDRDKLILNSGSELMLLKIKYLLD